MIITTTTHRGDKRGHAALARHLAKTENEVAVLAETGNTIATTLSEAIQIMDVYRAASTEVLLHHVTVNPVKDISREKLIVAVHQVRHELDKEGTRPYCIVVHVKKRAAAMGAGAGAGAGAGSHAHLILSASDAGGKALDSGWTKIRTERVARELEYDLGENPLCGRHHRSVLRALYATRPEVYSWLLEALGPNPEKPQSAISPGARNRARKQNLNLPKANASVRAIWQKSENLDFFRDGLRKIGFRIIAGEKEGVFVIVDQQGRLIGAANRLLRIRRKQFNKMMESSSEPAVRSTAVTDIERPGAFGRPDDHPHPEDRTTGNRDASLEFGTASDGGPRSAYHRAARSHGSEPDTSRKRAVRGQGTPGSGVGSHRRRTLVQLRRAETSSLHILLKLAQDVPPSYYAQPQLGADGDGLVHKDLWGIVKLPKPRW